MSETVKVTKAAGVIGIATFLSRIFGYIRDMVFAYFFGAGWVSDAFIAAFRIPNLLRRLFGEGSLSIAFVPVFTEYLTKQGRDEAFRLARSALKLLSIVVALTALAGIVLAPIVIWAIAHGFLDMPAKFSLTVLLTRIMFPYIFFISLVALCMGILNSLGHFAVPALAPVLLNLSMISAMLILSYLSTDEHIRAIGLSIGVLIGGILQLGLQLPMLVKKGIRFWQRAPLIHPGLKRIGRLMLPAVPGAAVYQINNLVITFFASLLADGSISYLYYADRLFQFPYALFGIALGTAALPSLSKQAANNDLEAMRATFTHAIQLVLFISIPAMVGLMVLGRPIIQLLFERGAFGPDATLATSQALFFYCLGLWAVASVRIVVAVYYAMQDTVTPVKIAAISISANIVLGAILMGPMGPNGLALALSLSSILNLILLVKFLRAKLGPLDWSSIIKSACKTLSCSAIMGALTWMFANLLIPAGNGPLIKHLGSLIVCIMSGMFVYGTLTICLKSTELNQLRSVIAKRITHR